MTPRVQSLVGRNLHLHPSHPLNIMKTKIERYFAQTFAESGQPVFRTFDSMNPKVTVVQNFDQLNVPRDHVSRRLNDTFYFDRETVLRTHTSAHQTELMRAGHRAFLATGDCYRRDEV